MGRPVAVATEGGCGGGDRISRAPGLGLGFRAARRHMFSTGAPQMNSNPKYRSIVAYVFAALVGTASFGTVTPAVAAPGDLVTSYALASAHSFALDPTRSRLYVTLEDSNSVAIIDTVTLQLIDTVFVGSAPRGVAVDPDGSRVFIATSGASFVAVMDADTFALLPSLPVPTNPSDVEFGSNDRLYVTPANQNVSGIMTVDATTGADLGTFNGSVSIYQNGLLEVSPDGNTLYFGNSGLSPGTAAKFDVSVSPPTLIYRNPHGDLGSNGQDLALSSDGQNLSYAVGGGNDGYVIFMMDAASDFTVLGSFDTGAYPREVTYGPDGSTVFTVHTSGAIDVFDTSTFLEVDSYATQGEASELVVSQDGARLFAAFDDEVRVYETGVDGAALPCGVETDASTYADGDTISVSLSLANAGIEPLAVEWKVWLELPDVGALSMINAGSDGSFMLPVDYTLESGPISVLQVDSSLSRGTGTLGCRLVDPATGATVFVQEQSFELE